MAVLHLAWLEIKLYIRESIAVLWTVAVPMGMLLVIAYAAPVESLETYAPIIVPGICTLIMMTAAIMGTVIPLVETREARIFELLGIVGMRHVSIFSAYVLSRGLIAFVTVMAVLLLGFALYPLTPAVSSPVAAAILLGVVVAGVFMFFNMAVTLSMFFKTSASANAVASVILGVFILLGGCYFDIAYLPPTLQRLAHLTPSYHVNDLLRVAIGAAQHPWESALAIAVYASLFTFANVLFFDWRHQRDD